MDRSGAYGVWRQAGCDGVYFERVKDVVTGQKAWMGVTYAEEKGGDAEEDMQFSTFFSASKVWQPAGMGTSPAAPFREQLRKLWWWRNHTERRGS